jgi:hypothetical protein
MAIVLRCSMTPHVYAAAGREVELERPDCPSCKEAMSFWGWYVRPLRLATEELRLAIRRARCCSCRVSHGIIPEFATIGRLDATLVIGPAIEEMAGGSTIAGITERVNLPYSTVRDWRRRFIARAELLAKGFLAVTVALGELVPRLCEDRVGNALIAIKAGAEAFARRRGRGEKWLIANRIVGGHLLTTNTDPPWIVD